MAVMTKPRFPDAFDADVALGSDRILFGRDVLRGLTEGLAEYRENPSGTWEVSFCEPRIPAVIGAVPWMNDERLVGEITKYGSACIVLNKFKPTQLAGTDPLGYLAPLAEADIGFPLRADPSLRELAPKVDGKPLMVGPDSECLETLALPPLRALGFPQKGRRPLLHAKVFVVGQLRWREYEWDFGDYEELGFEADRVWLGSANGTIGSRDSLEFGAWFHDVALVQAARKFVLRLIRYSEPVTSTSDLIEPELAEVDYDDDGMAMWAADIDYDDIDHDEPLGFEDEVR